MPLLFFKVWDIQRKLKTVIYLDSEEDDLLLKLIAKVCEKMKKNGSQIVLEKDGTIINEDIVLKHFENEVFILLEPTEEWQDNASHSTTTSQATTITNISNDMVQSENSDSIQLADLPLTDSVSSVVHSDTIQITYHIDCNSEYMWQLFEIPWDTLPKYMIEACENGKQDRQIITHIIHTIVNKMREIKTALPSLAIKIVTKKIIDKFPKAFRDVDEDGVVVSDGTYTVFKKMLERNNYLNRALNFKRKTQDNNSCNSNQNKKKLKIAERAGCSSWNPPVLEQIEENVECYKRNTSINETDANFFENMDKTYSKQRQFLNENPGFTVIQETWPILISKDGALYHFKKLTNSDLTVLPNLAEEKFEKFTKLAVSLKHEVNENNSKVMETFNIVSKYFKEDPEVLYQEVENAAAYFNNVEVMHPIIVKSLMEDRRYYVVYEKHLTIDTGFKTFDEAFQFAFAFYFNFNLKYPSGISLTLELFQRYFLKIHPDSGTKSTPKSRKSKNLKSRVISLINKLRNI